MSNDNQTGTGAVIKIVEPDTHGMPLARFRRITPKVSELPKVFFVLGSAEPKIPVFGKINNKITAPMMWVFSQIEE